MTNQLTDHEIIEQTLYNDREFYGRLIDRHKNSVYNYAYKLTGNHHESEDITMEAFIRAYKKLSDFKFSYKFRTWVYAIATNLVRDRIRRKKLIKIIPLSFLSRRTDEDEFEQGIPDSADGPVELLDKKESINNTKYIINSLPRKYREVFLLRCLEDMPYDEIAQITGLPIGTVENRLFRAKKILMGNHELIQKYYDNKGGFHEQG